MGRGFGYKRDEVTGSSTLFITKYITAYYYAHKMKDVEDSDTCCRNKGVDKRIRRFNKGSVMFTDGVDCLLIWRMQSIDFYVGWRLATLVGRL